MKALVQKVKSSSVSVDGRIVNSIGKGLNVLLGVHNEDAPEDAIKLAKKVLNLRIFEDDNGVMNKSILEEGGEILSSDVKIVNVVEVPNTNDNVMGYVTLGSISFIGLIVFLKKEVR